MFHKLAHFSSYTSLIRSPYLLYNNKKRVVFTNSSRLYCKSSSSGPKCPDDSDKQVHTMFRKPIDVCKPKIQRTCLPSPPCPPNRLGPNQCAPPKCRTEYMPKPDCPWDPADQEKKNKLMKRLLFGIVAAAVAIFAVWYNTDVTKPKEVKKTRMYRRPKPACRIPPKSEELPDHVPYLLVGGGTASFSAFRAIKSSDPTAKVLVISNECYNPYMRPPLSKELWYNKKEQNIDNLIFTQWNGSERSLYYEPDDFYTKPAELEKNPNGGVAIAKGYTVTKIDVINRTAYLDGGKQISYDKCLIATGATPRSLPIFSSASEEIKNKITIYRDIFDFQELNEICKDVKAIGIIGGGFLGSELACSLGKLGKKRNIEVYQIFKESGNMGKVLPEYLTEWTTDKVAREGVHIISKVEVEDATLTEDKRLKLHLNNGKNVIVDHAIVAVGVVPNTELANTSDLEVDPDFGGYLVNAEMEARSDLYVAGDCSCFYDVKLGRRRVEHHDHAVISGRLAGENMTGAKKPYVHQSMFWSDLGPHVGYEAIGHVTSELPTVGVFAKATASDGPQSVVDATGSNLRSTTEEEAKSISVSKDDSTKVDAVPMLDDYGKGVIFYLREGVVVGIVLWNVFNRMSIARQVLKDERKYDDLNEVAKLFNIHED